VKRILTSGLVGTALAVTPVLAGPRWWAVLLVVLLVLLVLLSIGLVYLVSLRMMIALVVWLVERAYPCSFKGPWGIELKAPVEPGSPEPEPPKPKLWPRRKPPPDSTS
jgi:hypothetical protein